MIEKVRKFLTDTLFVKDIKCIFCDRELDRPTKYCVCDDCLKNLPYITGKVCAKCGEPIQSMATHCMRCKNHVDRGFDLARARFLYDDKISKAIKDFKYYGKKYLGEYLSNFMYDVYAIEKFSADVIIPAPISANGLKARGFNQTELLCKSFADNGLNVNSKCVIKKLETENQANLNFKERQTNLIGAFKVVDKNAVKNKNCLIVDDIFTTGATVGEIGAVLKKAGAKRVDVITLCHELPTNVKN